MSAEDDAADEPARRSRGRIDRVIHNPRSKRAARGRAAVESQLRELEPSREIPWVTLDELAETPTDAESRVLVIGGDGTINAVANWVADLPAAVRPTIAIVPAGTGNNLARDLGYPIDPQCAVDAIRHSTRERTLDLIRIRDGVRGDAIHAIQSVSLGFAACVAARYDALRRRRWFRAVTAPLGQYVYRCIGATELAAEILPGGGTRTIVGRVTLGDESFEDRFLGIFVNNERSLGGQFTPCPAAVPDDGILDACLLRAGRKRHYPGLFLAVGRGTHPGRYEEAVIRRGMTSVDIELDAPTPVLVDGDLPLHSAALRIDLSPHLLRIACP